MPRRLPAPDQTPTPNQPPKPFTTRVVLRGPAADAEPLSLWADVRDAGGGVEVRFAFAYPDLAPGPGWRVEAGGRTYAVTAADAGTLTCAEGGAP